jgi:uncharacterized membrane protein YgcG
VVEQWKLGRKRVDDGALLIIAKDDRALHTEVGYGLEGVLTDAASKRNISEDIVPRFKQGDFYGGVSAGIDRMLGVIEGEPLPPPEETAGDRGDPMRQLMPILLVLTLIPGGVLRSMLGRSRVQSRPVGPLVWSRGCSPAPSLPAWLREQSRSVHANGWLAHGLANYWRSLGKKWRPLGPWRIRRRWRRLWRWRCLR